VYGEKELGGTQVMFMSAVSFDKFALPDFPDKSFASTSNSIQGAIYTGMIFPLAVLAGLMFIVKKNTQQEETKTAEKEKDNKEENHE
jgi:hypothetical protein